MLNINQWGRCVFLERRCSSVNEFVDDGRR